jgi:hypothetical protein
MAAKRHKIRKARVEMALVNVSVWGHKQVPHPVEMASPIRDKGNHPLDH